MNASLTYLNESKTNSHPETPSEENEDVAHRSSGASKGCLTFSKLISDAQRNLLVHYFSASVVWDIFTACNILQSSASKGRAATGGRKVEIPGEVFGGREVWQHRIPCFKSDPWIQARSNDKKALIQIDRRQNS